MGNITGAMVFQIDDPHGGRARVRVRARGIATDGSYTAFASAGIAFLAAGAIFIPMARTGRLRGRDLLVGGLLYLGYLAFVIAVISGVF